MKRVSLLFTLALATALSAQGVAAETLKTVKDRGMLSCGVSQGLPGFSAPDSNNNWTGLEVDFCRALAAAIFNDYALPFEIVAFLLLAVIIGAIYLARRPEEDERAN